MDKTIHEPWIKLKSSLCQEDYDLIHSLQLLCSREDQITLKLELDYKLSDAVCGSDNTKLYFINEFMYFRGTQLVGYIGISAFGGASAPLEVTGMVHPDYRRQGIFSKLFELALAQCKERNASTVLLLCDRNSAPGQMFLKNVGAVYSFSEFEMYLQDAFFNASSVLPCGISLIKATNADAFEIARQNAIYFGDSLEAVQENLPLPEDEEKRGMTIYLAKKGNLPIGKVHLQLANGLGGIYGLGVLPEYRRKGLGRAILLEAIGKLKVANAAEVMLQVAAENATALNLYKSCGLRETSVMDYFKLEGGNYG